MRLNILVILNNPLEGRLRNAIRDLVECYARYSQHTVTYVNYHYNETIPRNIPFDIIIFNTLFLYNRWDFVRIPDSDYDYLKTTSAVKAMVPQDEYFNTDKLCELINRVGMNIIFTIAPESEWEKIYDAIDRSKVKIYKVLTGYLSPDIVQRIETYAAEITSRPIDIFYRSYKGLPGVPRYWLGRHGALKWLVAEKFQEHTRSLPLNVDISMREEDTLFEDDWYKRLLSSKYIIGVEGGASILDRDRSIAARAQEYLSLRPDAPFEEVEAACFPGMDGQLTYIMPSPRHLEACATRTCQVLIEGEYNGILKPWEHYIPVKRDFSNIDEVLDIIMRDELRHDMVERAYDAVIKSEKYFYQSFVDFIIEKSLHYRHNHAPKAVSVQPVPSEPYQPILDQLKGMPESVSAWKMLALTARHRGDMSTAQSACEAILSLAPNADVSGILGASAQAQVTFPPEEHEFAEVLQADPANKKLWVAYAYYCIKRGNIGNARVAYESIKALSPDDVVLESLRSLIQGH